MISEMLAKMADYTVGTGIVLLHLLMIRVGREGLVPLSLPVAPVPVPVTARGTSERRYRS